MQEYITQSGFYMYRYYSVYGNKILTDSIFFSIAESPTDTTVIEPPVIIPPDDTTAVVPPTDTTTPTDTVVIIPPTDTIVIVPPTDTTIVVPPTDTTIVIPPTDTVVIIPPTDTTVIIPPSDTIISPADTTISDENRNVIREFKIVNLIVVDEYELTYLKVINIDCFTNVELQVFSSRGEQIYHTKDYHNELDMKPFKDGVYYYFIKGVDKENYKYQTKKGFVQLYHKQ
jgi:hypothetical protein